MKVLKKDKRDKYTEAYIDYYPIVLNTLYTRLADKDLADDLCQEIFIILFRKIDTVENIRAWLNGTIRNILGDYFRRKKDEVIDIDNVFNDVSLTFVNGFKDTRLIISEAVKNIECNKTERQILDLIATNNFSYREVAKILGLTRRQVEYKYGLIVKRLTDYLSKKGIDSIEELL